MSKISKEDIEDWNQRLFNLVRIVCQYPIGNINRRLGFNQIVRMIQQSGKQWREYASYYEDALQDTWLYFSRNLCEGENNTAKPFCRADCKIIARFNKYLKWRLRDYAVEVTKELDLRISPRFSKEGKLIDPVNLIQAPKPLPNWCEEIRIWAENDISGQLQNTHIKGHSEVNCRILILRRLPPEKAWKDLSVEFGLSISTLSGFYEKKCRPLLHQFGKSEGYF